MLAELRRQGREICDLTASNPTEEGFAYPSEAILEALTSHEVLRYTPDPFGLLQAREAVEQYYASKNITRRASEIVLTAGTSEAYAWLFTLLCDAGENILVPAPSYPLFDYLARLHDVEVRAYPLRYDGEWHIAWESVEQALTKQTRAIVLVSPHNPTGMFLKREELARLNRIAAQHRLALIVDEVFAEYGCGNDDRRVTSTAANDVVLTFTLNGISKLCGLPQMKLGWIVVSGPPSLREEALHRLEIVADTFLSVNTPAQVALPRLLQLGERVRAAIQQRLRDNRVHLEQVFSASSPLSLLSSEGGWYAVLKIPRTKMEEEWAMKLLSEEGVLVYPGYFFDFVENGYLVVSLLTRAESFREGIDAIGAVISP